MGQVVDDYNPQSDPSIAVPRGEHIKIPTLKGDYSSNARDLLARDIANLRKYTNAPNSALRELIDLNKSMYPNVFKKL